LQPWQLLVAVLAGWINEHQQAAIEYLREENRVVEEQLGEEQPLLVDGRAVSFDHVGRARAW
jgi:hypothetical protein